MPSRPTPTALFHELNEPARLFSLHSPDVQVIIRPDRVIDWVNATWTKMLGYEFEVTVGKEFDRFVHPEDMRLFHEAVEMLGKQDLTALTRFRMIKLGGDVVRVGVRGTFFNKHHRSYVTLRDVSLALAYEREMQAQTRRFQVLVENSPSGIAILSRAFVVLYENPAVTDILGYRRDERIGQGAFDNLHPEDLKLVMDQMARAIGQSGYLTLLNYRARRADGQYTRIEARVQNLLDDPAVRGFVMHSRDISRWTQPGGLS